MVKRPPARRCVRRCKPGALCSLRGGPRAVQVGRGSPGIVRGSRQPGKRRPHTAKLGAPCPDDSHGLLLAGLALRVFDVHALRDRNQVADQSHQPGLATLMGLDELIEWVSCVAIRRRHVPTGETDPRIAVAHHVRLAAGTGRQQRTPRHVASLHGHQP